MSTGSDASLIAKYKHLWVESVLSFAFYTKSSILVRWRIGLATLSQVWAGCIWRYCHTLILRSRILYTTALVIYEHLVLLKYDIEFLWRRKWSAVTWIFVFNRYLLLATVLFSISPAVPQVSHTIDLYGTTLDSRWIGVSFCIGRATWFDLEPGY